MLAMIARRRPASVETVQELWLAFVFEMIPNTQTGPRKVLFTSTNHHILLHRFGWLSFCYGASKNNSVGVVVVVGPVWRNNNNKDQTK
jgi:hypothetical protein